MMIPLQAKDGIPKFEFFTIHPKFTSTLPPRDLSETKSEVTEAPKIPDKTFPENFKFFKDLGISKFKVSEVPEITENEIAVSDVHHFNRILMIHHLLKMTNSG